MADIERTLDPFVRARLQERLAGLAGQIATVTVGAATDAELERRKYCAVSALNSVYAAIAEGCVVGGGVSLFHAQELISRLVLPNAGELAGVTVVAKALEAPLIALSFSCHLDPVATLTALKGEFASARGVDVGRADVVDLAAAGIWDPAKTLRKAVDVASSFAGTILRTAVWGVQKGEADEAESAGSSL